MIWVLVQVQNGVTVGVETFTTEVVAQLRVEELRIDFDWNNDDLSLFAGEVGSEFERLAVEPIDIDGADKRD